MATRLSLSTETAEFVGASNSFMTGATGLQGNIAATVGPTIRDLGEIYVGAGGLTWAGGIDTSVTPNVGDVGIFTVASDQVAGANTSADYECRRNNNLITSNGRIQIAISENNGYAPPADSRWCIYYGSEDFNVAVVAQEYNTTDPNDVNQGNNIEKLLDLTERLHQMTGQNGPINLNGTANVDLYGQNGIFKKGCLVTWESGGTAGEAVYVAPEV